MLLPPNSPEINLRQYRLNKVSDKFFMSYTPKSIDSVRAKFKRAILYFERNEYVQSSTFYLISPRYSNVEMV